jgi:hypothetical protein
MATKAEAHRDTTTETAEVERYYKTIGGGHETTDLFKAI